MQQLPVNPQHLPASPLWMSKSVSPREALIHTSSHKTLAVCYGPHLRAEEMGLEAGEQQAILVLGAASQGTSCQPQGF